MFQFVQRKTPCSRGFYTLFSDPPSSIYILAITSVFQNYKPVSNLNPILFPNLQLIQFPDIKPLHIILLCCFFIFCQSFPNFCNDQLVISITVNFSDKSYVQFIRMSFPIHQYVISPVVSVHLRKALSVIRKVLMWEYLFLNN